MAEKKNERRGLGRGLSALMADVSVDSTVMEPGEAPKRPYRMVPVESIAANPDQPRRHFTQDALNELAASIKERGVLQPLILRPDPSRDGQYQIVAGERRWRASQMARLHEVPAIIRDFNDTEVLEVAIIENIQRADLNPVEEAAGYRQLMDRFGHTQEQMAEALGKSRSHIANLLRLLNLPEEVREMLSDGRLTTGHARALITTDDPVGLARKVVEKGLSVRETEKLAKGQGGGSRPRNGSAQRQEKDADTRALEADLSANLGMGISIDHEPGGDRGRVTIHYRSLDQLDDLCRVLSESGELLNRRD